MLKIVKNNIWLTRGDAAYLRLNVKVKETGQPFDYSNCLTRLTVKKNAISNTVIFQKTFSDGRIKIDPEDTINLDYQTLKYDVHLITPNDDPFTVIADMDFTITKEEHTHVNT